MNMDLDMILTLVAVYFAGMATVLPAWRYWRRQARFVEEQLMASLARNRAVHRQAVFWFDHYSRLNREREKPETAPDLPNWAEDRGVRNGDET